MAKLINVKLIDGEIPHYEFSLSNKPEFVFLCDPEDLHILEKGTWYVHLSTKHKTAQPYIRTVWSKTNKEVRHFHREVLKAGPYSALCVVDHLNRNSLDCRKYNLELKTSVENLKNCDKQHKNKELYKKFEPYGDIENFTVFMRSSKYFQVYYKTKHIITCKDFNSAYNKVKYFFENNKDET